MIKVIHYQNEATDRVFEANIAKYYDEVRELLPELPETIHIYFSDFNIMAENGIGGFAYSHDTITISIDPDFADKERQRSELRPTVFHEAFHVYQKYTGESGPFSAIDNALYEGMATVFERQYCDVWESYGDYRQTPDKVLQQWLKAIQQLSLDEFIKSYRAWKFYHPKLKERWIIYKVGTWLVDKVLKKYNLKIHDLSTKTAAQVLDMYTR